MLTPTPNLPPLRSTHLAEDTQFFQGEPLRIGFKRTCFFRPVHIPSLLVHVLAPEIWGQRSLCTSYPISRVKIAFWPLIDDLLGTGGTIRACLFQRMRYAGPHEQAPTYDFLLSPLAPMEGWPSLWISHPTGFAGPSERLFLCPILDHSRIQSKTRPISVVHPLHSSHRGQRSSFFAGDPLIPR